MKYFVCTILMFLSFGSFAELVTVKFSSISPHVDMPSYEGFVTYDTNASSSSVINQGSYYCGKNYYDSIKKLELKNENGGLDEIELDGAVHKITQNSSYGSENITNLITINPKDLLSGHLKIHEFWFEIKDSKPDNYDFTCPLNDKMPEYGSGDSKRLVVEVQSSTYFQYSLTEFTTEFEPPTESSVKLELNGISDSYSIIDFEREKINEYLKEIEDKTQIEIQ